MWEYESTDKSIFQRILGVGVVFTKGTPSECVNVLKTHVVRAPLPPPLGRSSSSFLSCTERIRQNLYPSDRKYEEVSPVGEQ